MAVCDTTLAFRIKICLFNLYGRSPTPHRRNIITCSVWFHYYYSCHWQYRIKKRLQLVSIFRHFPILLCTNLQVIWHQHQSYPTLEQQQVGLKFFPWTLTQLLLARTNFLLFNLMIFFAPFCFLVFISSFWIIPKSTRPSLVFGLYIIILDNT